MAMIELSGDQKLDSAILLERNLQRTFGVSVNLCESSENQRTFNMSFRGVQLFKLSWIWSEDESKWKCDAAVMEMYPHEITTLVQNS